MLFPLDVFHETACVSLWELGCILGRREKREKDRNKRRSAPCGNVDSGHQNISGAQTRLSPEPRHREQPLISRCLLHYTALPLAAAWSRGQRRDPPVLLRLHFNGNFTAAAFRRYIAVWYKRTGLLSSPCVFRGVKRWVGPGGYSCLSQAKINFGPTVMWKRFF